MLGGRTRAQGGGEMSGNEEFWECVVLVGKEKKKVN